jgi:SAM-dependent methyltransferase
MAPCYPDRGLRTILAAWCVLAAVAPAAADALDAQARAMLDPIRNEALHPSELIARLRLRPTDAIADVGAGPGFFTVPLAQAVPRGSVLATDLDARYLALAADRAQKAGVTNVRTRIVPRERPDLAPSSVDVVFLAQVDHYLADRASYFALLAAALRPSGRLVIVNYEKFRAPDLAAAAQAGLKVIDEWQPTPPFFVAVWKKP